LHDYVHDHAVYAAGRGILVKNSIFRDITAGMSIKIDHHRGDKASGSEWTHRIINNTFHGDDNPIASGAITFFRNQEYRSYNVVIANNVFHQPSNNDGGQQDTAIVAGNLGSKTCPTDSHIDPNTTTIVNNVTNSEYLFAACENEIKASGVWSNNTALNNRSSDIGMIDPDNHDFRLTKDATFLVDKASDTYAPKYDYLGNARPYGNTDISAYEYGSGAREYPPEPPEGLRVLQ
jgi:hypothetical protein